MICFEILINYFLRRGWILPYYEFYEREPEYYLHELKDKQYANGPNNGQVSQSVVQAHAAAGDLIALPVR